MFLSTAISLTTIFISSAWAQFDTAHCPSGFDWNENSLGQDPCVIGSILDASCRGLMEYVYQPLTESTRYYPPPRASHSGDVMCDCNTVMYSLYMACASCQGGEIYSWVQWIPQCATVHISQYPANIPQGTAVPRWAYYDVTTLPNQTWNESVAMDIGRYPEQLLGPTDTEPPDSTSTTPHETPNIPTAVTSTEIPAGLSEPTIPTSNTNLQLPTSPAQNTDVAGPTNAVNSTSFPEPTNPNDSTEFPGPTNPTTSNTNLLRPTDPPGSSTTLPGPTNADSTNTEGGTNFWAVSVALFLWVFM